MGVFLCYNIYMLMFGLLSWWYGDGWRSFGHELFRGLRNTADFFSVSSLFKTFFAPFRQISANDKFLDRLISRVIGSVTRFFLIVFGLIVVALEAVFSIVVMTLWFLMPLMPIACVVLFVVGVVYV